jgi:hypothetical protein
MQNVFPITAAGPYTLDPSVSLVTVNVAGAVTITLPSAIDPSYAGAGGAQPGLFANNPITIVDIGGHAFANNITIMPAPGENIMGLASIQITTDNGAFTLAPNSTQHGWNSISPCRLISTKAALHSRGQM